MKKKDLEQIGNLFSTSFAQIWEHNLEPVLTNIQTRLGSVETRVGSLEKKVGSLGDKMVSLEEKVSSLPTKEYIDDKLANFKVEMNNRFKK